MVDLLLVNPGQAMIGDDHDEATFEMMLEAAAAITEMARTRPADAAAMLEQARHLVELAEQIRSDWQRRQNANPLHGLSAAAQAGRSGTY